MAATARDLADFRQIQNDVVALAYREILAFWRTLDYSDPVGAVLALEAFLPEVIQAYGEIGAAAAADFYEELRDSSPAVRQAYAAVIGDAAPIEAVQTSTKWAAAPLFKRDVEGHLYIPKPDPDSSLGRIIDITDRFIKEQYRNTISKNVLLDPARPKYARVPTGAETCAYCLFQASRGAVFLTEESAARDFHGKCDCVPTPVWDEAADLPEGYNPEELRDTVYADAKRESDGSMRDILAKMREQQGIR